MELTIPRESKGGFLFSLTTLHSTVSMSVLLWTIPWPNEPANGVSTAKGTEKGTSLSLRPIASLRIKYFYPIEGLDYSTSTRLETSSYSNPRTQGHTISRISEQLVSLKPGAYGIASFMAWCQCP